MILVRVGVRAREEEEEVTRFNINRSSFMCRSWSLTETNCTYTEIKMICMQGVKVGGTELNEPHERNYSYDMHTPVFSQEATDPLGNFIQINSLIWGKLTYNRRPGQRSQSLFRYWFCNTSKHVLNSLLLQYRFFQAVKTLSRGKRDIFNRLTLSPFQ